MVLRPDEALHAQMAELMNSNSTGAKRDSERLKASYVPSDPGDQSVWRHFFSHVHELPVKYNTFKKTTFRRVEQWANVHVLHDSDVHRGVRIPLPSVHTLYQNLTIAAADRVARMAANLGVVNRG
eukprot:CAMPEP_0115837330 /NCGR_PEP_ID=MMETSP0287-20121206/5163_1 /TAXON_ID=412157 /ORGANISM="Chrysochromulina rotalis, Strain UIO044" /LENGTH=124 /DNA_ID=CAMNT_0003290833 /DNA_START=144 /DNA_END=518 /DNA_ORIENTATION=+